MYVDVCRMYEKKWKKMYVALIGSLNSFQIVWFQYQLEELILLSLQDPFRCSDHRMNDLI